MHGFLDSLDTESRLSDGVGAASPGGAGYGGGDSPMPASRAAKRPKTIASASHGDAESDQSYLFSDLIADTSRKVHMDDLMVAALVSFQRCRYSTDYVVPSDCGTTEEKEALAAGSDSRSRNECQCLEKSGATIPCPDILRIDVTALRQLQNKDKLERWHRRHVVYTILDTALSTANSIADQLQAEMAYLDEIYDGDGTDEASTRTRKPSWIFDLSHISVSTLLQRIGDIITISKAITKLQDGCMARSAIIIAPGGNATKLDPIIRLFGTKHRPVRIFDASEPGLKSCVHWAIK
jgi:hypothetical protein